MALLDQGQNLGGLQPDPLQQLLTAYASKNPEVLRRLLGAATTDQTGDLLAKQQALAQQLQFGAQQNHPYGATAGIGSGLQQLFGGVKQGLGSIAQAKNIQRQQDAVKQLIELLKTQTPTQTPQSQSSFPDMSQMGP